jgi:hypothetical protein
MFRGSDASARAVWLNPVRKEGDDMAGRVRGVTVAGLIVLTGATVSAAQSRDSSSPSTASAPDRASSTPGTTAPKSAPTARGPLITILTPKAGSTVHGSTVRVSVLVKRFKVVPRQFQPPVAGEGHVHFYLDVKTLPTTHTYPSPVPYRSISGTTYTWTGVSPGRHTVAVQLVGNDHVPFRPQVKDRVTVTVH